jgi:hypothetical protein
LLALVILARGRRSASAGSWREGPRCSSCTAACRSFELFGFVKFYDASTADEDPTNYYMEREWRCLTNIRFSVADLRRIIVPQVFVERLRGDFPQYAGEIMQHDKPGGRRPYSHR